MNDLARRLDPCANWFRLLARTKGRILWVFPVGLLAAYLGVLSRGRLLSDLMDRFHQRGANAPLLAEARSLDLDYEAVAARPAAFVGKPVVWCVDTPSAGRSYVSGRPSWPVALNAPFEDYRTNPTTGGYCYKVLAVVTGFQDGLIQLRAVEKL